MGTYAMLKDYKRLNLASLAKELPINYQTLQYFLAESKWNYESLNATRIKVLRTQRTTGFSKDGDSPLTIPAPSNRTLNIQRVSLTNTAPQ